MLDVLIRSGNVIDGTGTVQNKTDIGIQGERIVEIGNLTDTQAAQTIDATNLVVCPGFIDMHSHADFTLPGLPTADSKIHQGITFELVGNCGSSTAPLNDEMRQEAIENTLLGGDAGLTWEWDTFTSYLDTLRRIGTSVNVGALVGHGTVRTLAMGMVDSEPTPGQMEIMQTEVKLAMEAGAFGISTGLIYPPNVYAKTAEIISLARIAANYGGIYTSHIRGEGDTVLDAIDEAIRVGREANIPVQISHLKAEYRPNWPKMKENLARIEKARSEGLDVNADMYPYTACNTGLTSLLPDWAHVGGRNELMKRLIADGDRARMRSEMSSIATRDAPGYWERTFISFCAQKPEYEGHHIQEIADGMGKLPEDTVMDILLAVSGAAEMIQFLMCEENVEMGLKYAQVMIGTDGEGRAAEGLLSSGKPHPRNFGTFPRVLGYYTREKKILPLEETIRKMTSLPAAKLHLKDRGTLKKGNYADITIFDPLNVVDKSTFTHPQQYPEGIIHVMVNGKSVINNGVHTRVKPGKIITR